MSSTRLDALLVQRGLSPSREKAKEVIATGQVFVNGTAQTKPSFSCVETDEVVVTAPPERYVSRGGHKLERAIDVFGISLANRFCLDIGASTGGFTDCCLQNGAAHVVAVDVGSDQLAASLRADPRVTCREHTDFRVLRAEDFPQPVTFLCADVSFISLRLLFPVIRSLLSQDGEAVCLVKPQFEAGPSAVGKKGVVRDPKVHERVLLDVIEAAALQSLYVHGLTASPIRGQNGNIEYLIRLLPVPPVSTLSAADVKQVVRTAQQTAV